MNCPLCESEKYFSLGSFDIRQLKLKWQKEYGFIPLEFASYETLEKMKCSTCYIDYYSPELIGAGEFYKKLSSFSWYYQKDKWEYDEALALVYKNKPKSILEFGCGEGHFLDKVRTAVDKVCGVEINPKAHVVLKKKNIKFTENLDLITDQYDMICSFQVLEHVSQAKNIIESFLQKLAVGGKLVLSVPNPDGVLKFVKDSILDLPPHHFSSWHYKTFEFLAEKYNLQILHYLQEDMSPVGYKIYIQSEYEKYVQIFSPGILKRLISRIFSCELLKLFSPIFRRKINISGHTHLVVLQVKHK